MADDCRVFLDGGEYLITSPFGNRIHPKTLKPQLHEGEDIVAKVWKADVRIKPLASGYISKILRDVQGYSEKAGETGGNYVVIGHSNGLESWYKHLRHGSIPEHLKVGDKVYANTFIGIMGTTGLSTGVHLHLEIGEWKDGKPKRYDPEPYLQGRILIPGHDELEPKEAVDMGYIEIKKTLKHRDRGEEVKLLQQRFTQLSKEFEIEVKKHSFKADGTPDGGYGDGMKLSVIKFQKMCGLPETGNVDEPTRQMLNATPWDMQERIRQLLLEKASVQAEKTALQSEIAKKEDKIVKAKNALNDILKSI